MRNGFGIAIAFADKNREYARANLLLMSKDKRDDNLLSICFPSKEDLAIPSFSLYYILDVREYMEYTADASLGEEVFDKIESILSVFLGDTQDGLATKRAGDNYWNFYDWSEYCVSTYKPMADGGSGTVWETIEGAEAFDNAGSLCHGWSAIPIYYFDLLKD